MDTYEATRIVLSRIQNLDPENASKIMGLLLIQDHGEKEMIRLAFGPESLVHSVVYKARKDLGLASNSPSSTPLSPSSSPSPFRPLSRPSLPSPLSIPNHSWDSPSSFSDYHGPADPELISPNTALSPFQKHSSMNSAALPFYASREGDLIDEFHLENHLSFLNDGVKSPDLYNPHQDLASAAAEWGGAGFHRRSCSVSDLDPSFGSDADPGFGFGWKPCLYYARGYCKNGNSCRFVHGGAAADVGSDSVVGSPEQCHELLRSKSVQQQRLAAASQLMASSSFPYSALAANKCLNLLLQQQQIDSPRGVMMGEDMLKFGRSRLDRSEFPMNGAVGMMSPGSRQIYLTFPADSTFREEDVSNYFSIYGPVQDVRIPYQQKRMFGFVTFVYPETVKLILAKGNPHFVCDARVLVKPYKEKGKVPDKYRKFQQQMERGEFSACGSPTGLDSRDPYDINLGGRMFCDSQDLMWRSKLEERLMGLQLLDVKRPIHHRTLSTGASFPSPPPSPHLKTQKMSKILSLPAISNCPNPNPNFPNPPRHRRSRAATLTRSSLTDQSLSSSAAKRDLLDLISDQDRGLRTQNDPSRLSKIVEAIDALAVSGRDTVTTGQSLSGTWRLMWTTEKEQLFIIKNAFLFGTRTGDVLQVIDVDEGVLNNVITFPPHGVFFVRSTIEIASTQRVNFRFTSAVLRGENWELPLPPFGQGWFESVYLDDEIRVVKDIRGDYLVVDQAPYSWKE